VVDDEADIRLLTALTLDEAGYHVDTAADGAEALLVLEVLRPDLLLLDLVMPEMDGWDVIQAVRANPRTRDLPIVAMSAKFGLMRTTDHGIQAYLPKPCDPMAMLSVIDEVLRQHSAPTTS